MDTITEGRMAIAMAEFGGIGIIHRFLPIEAQVREVTLVKRCQSRVIEDPHTISSGATIEQARQLMEQLGINGLPVVEDDRLVGILTQRDIHLAVADAPVSTRMTPWDRLVMAQPGISLEEARRILLERRLEKLPVVDSRGRLVGLITAKDLSREQGFDDATCDDKGRLRVAATVGVVGDFIERSQALVEAEADALVIDIAHGDSAMMLSAVRKVRERLGDVPLVAGNVATAEGTERLSDAGVDAIQVGVGPGSMCTTRQVAGAGVPQFTAVLESAEVAHKHGVPVIADGGLRYPGDIAKAIGAGASTVKLGNLLAGTDESPGLIMMRDGGKVKVARGMASREAAFDRALRDDPVHGLATWESTETHTTPEGIQATVPYRGSVPEVLQELLGGLRSGMSYCDAINVEQMWRNARFVCQTRGGIREAGPHVGGA